MIYAPTVRRSLLLPSSLYVVTAMSLLALLFFVKAFRPGYIIFAHDMLMAYPAQWLLHDQLQQGEIPLWNPYTAAGDPLFGWFPLFYPLNLLATWLIPTHSFALLYWLHMSITGVGMYAYVRQLGATRWGAALSSVAFMYGSPLTVRMLAGHMMYVYAIAWIPLIFWGVERMLQSRSFRPALWVGIALGLQLLSPLVQIYYYTVLSLGLYSVVRLVWFKRDAIWLYALRLGCSLAVSLGIGAVYLVPAILFQATTLRSDGLTYLDATSGSLPFTHYLLLIFPHLFGTPPQENFWGTFLRGPEFFESGLYIGLIPLCLALVALKQRNAAHVWPLVVVMGLALFLAAGRFTPLYTLALTLLPGMDTFRVPARAALFVSFGLTTLAGLGLSQLEVSWRQTGIHKWMGRVTGGLALICGAAWWLTFSLRGPLEGIGTSLARTLYAQSNWEHSRPLEYSLRLVSQIADALPSHFLLPTVVFTVLALLWHTQQTHKFWFLAGLLALTLCDLLWVNRLYLPMIHTNEILSLDQESLLTHVPSSPLTGRIYAEKNYLPIHLGVLYGYADVQGDSPTTLRAYWETINYSHRDTLTQVASERSFFKSFNGRALQLLNVTRAFTSEPIEHPDWHLRAQSTIQHSSLDLAVSHTTQMRTHTVYVNEHLAALPRAMLVYNVRSVADDAEALTAVHDPNFNAQSEVVLSESVQPVGPVPIQPSTVQIETYQPNRITVTTVSEAPGILVLSELYAPGWRVHVDGVAAELLQANYILRGVHVPAGVHSISFIYWPPGLTAGLGLTLATLTGMILVWVATLVRKDKTRNSHDHHLGYRANL